jgi:hypothetical protein
MVIARFRDCSSGDYGERPVATPAARKHSESDTACGVYSMLIRLGDIFPATSKGENPFTTKDTEDTKEAWIFSNFFLRVPGVLRGENVF